MTGIMTNGLLNGRTFGTVSAEFLEHLKHVAIDTNIEWAGRLDIPTSAAVTCLKPEGTSSQLVNTTSGIHAAFAPYFIRRVRQDKKDPLTQFMIDEGVSHEDDVMNSENVVFSFPQASPEGAVLRNEMTAIEQLEHWRIFRDHWCEHNPSITVYIKEKEWPSVGGWVWDNFDAASGLAFLPHSDHIYKQAPYEEITEAEYVALRAEEVEPDWSRLSNYEKEDNTTGNRELSCTAGACEI
jgi:ribonucleoside-diphosphate reductase alpha chain